jgi:hypothetical protein
VKATDCSSPITTHSNQLQLEGLLSCAVGVQCCKLVLTGVAVILRSPSGDLESESLIESAAASKVMVVPGHLISVPHLQAAHKKKQALMQAAQQQALQAQAQSKPQQAEGDYVSQQALLAQLQGLTEQLLQQQDGGNGVAHIAAQLSTISQQLQRLQQLGNGSSPAAPATPTLPSAVSAPAQNVDTEHVPCPFFRVSFVSVPAEAIREGFVRLRAAILSCHGPKTPPGEESEMASCSSSIGCSGSHAVVAGAQGGAAAATVQGDSALC